MAKQARKTAAEANAMAKTAAKKMRGPKLKPAFKDGEKLPKVKPQSKEAEAKAKPASDVNQIWAVGTKVEHPAHGVGIVCGHTQTDGVVEVSFDIECVEDQSVGVEGIEIHQDELKLVRPKGKAEQAIDLAVKLHKPHTEKRFNFPKRKVAAKVQKVLDGEIAALWKKLGFAVGDQVTTVDEPTKAYGKIVTTDIEDLRTGHIKVITKSDELVLLDTNQAKLVKFNPKKLAKLAQQELDAVWKNLGFAIGQKIAPKETPNECFGVLVDTALSDLRNGMVHIEDVDGDSGLWDVGSIVLFKKPKVEKVAFKDVGLFAGFSFKGATHVKVGNTSAIRVPVHDQSVSEPAPFVYVATPEFQISPTAKVRFKTSERVALLNAPSK